MFSDMDGWVITRPGFPAEPKRVATWWMGQQRNDVIRAYNKDLCDLGAWEKARRKGYRCEKARIVVSIK